MTLNLYSYYILKVALSSAILAFQISFAPEQLQITPLLVNISLDFSQVKTLDTLTINIQSSLDNIFYISVEGLTITEI